MASEGEELARARAWEQITYLRTLELIKALQIAEKTHDEARERLEKLEQQRDETEKAEVEH